MLNMNFTEMPIADWGYRASQELSPIEILKRLAAEILRAIDNWGLASVDLEQASDAAHSGFQRVNAQIPVSADLFDAFFNGQSGYRAQYAISVAEGERFNRSAIDLLAPILVPLEDRYFGDFDRDFCARSIGSLHTKLWFPKSISDPIREGYLATLPEEISVSRWRRWWEHRSPPRKGLLAPNFEEPAVLLNGTFIRPVDGAIWDQKPGRSVELHERGWT
jgi:hypothetical protein